ncbi:MAG: hypothetical protein WDA75_09110 [Candidatus Latescibacterota bacterium]
MFANEDLADRPFRRGSCLRGEVFHERLQDQRALQLLEALIERA